MNKIHLKSDFVNETQESSDEVQLIPADYSKNLQKYQAAASKYKKCALDNGNYNIEIELHVKLFNVLNQIVESEILLIIFLKNFNFSVFC